MDNLFTPVYIYIYTLYTSIVKYCFFFRPEHVIQSSKWEKPSATQTQHLRSQQEATHIVVLQGIVGGDVSRRLPDLDQAIHGGACPGQ